MPDIQVNDADWERVDAWWDKHRPIIDGANVDTQLRVTMTMFAKSSLAAKFAATRKEGIAVGRQLIISELATLERERARLEDRVVELESAADEARSTLAAVI